MSIDPETIAELSTADISTAPELAGTLYVLREGRESDRPYITRSWVSCAVQSAMARGLGVAFKREHTALVWKWVQHPATVVRVAADPNDSDTILGFCVFGGSCLHYVHVRQDFRGLGIARALLDGAEWPHPNVFTHRVSDCAFRDADDAKRRTPDDWSFNPYPFLRGPA